jgi:U3 small nucleolar RNA-associated protein 6
VKRRTAFQYSIHRRISRKADFLRYIEYEINLERLRKKRKTRLRLDVKPLEGEKGYSKADFSITKRIHTLYQQALKKFPGDMQLWFQYFEWGRSSGGSKTMGKNFARFELPFSIIFNLYQVLTILVFRAIQLHPTKPSVWILASKWEFEDNANIGSARILLQRAIRVNKESKLLWLEYFKLELLWIEKIKQRRKILFGDDLQSALEQVVGNVRDSSSNHEASIQLPVLNIERIGQEQDVLEVDVSRSASLNEAAQESQLVTKNALSSIQKTILEVAIPRAIYRNAIKGIVLQGR